MTKNEMVAQFKNEMRNYKYYSSMLDMLNERLSNLWYEYEGVKAIQYDKDVTNTNYALIEERKFTLSEKIKKLDAQIERIDEQVRYIDNILINMSDLNIRNAIVDVYINKTPMRKVCKEYFISHTGLMYQMDKEIYKAIVKVYE